MLSSKRGGCPRTCGWQRVRSRASFWTGSSLRGSLFVICWARPVLVCPDPADGIGAVFPCSDTASSLRAGGASRWRTTRFLLASRSLPACCGVDCPTDCLFRWRWIIFVRPHTRKKPEFLRFELKGWWHDRLTFSYFTPLHAPMLLSTTSI